MARLIFDHSKEEWIEKLTIPEQELTLSERDAIAGHVAACPDCARIVAENTLLKRFIQAIPTPAMPSGLPPRLLQLWEKEDAEANVKTGGVEHIFWELME